MRVLDRTIHQLSDRQGRIFGESRRRDKSVNKAGIPESKSNEEQGEDAVWNPEARLEPDRPGIRKRGQPNRRPFVLFSHRLWPGIWVCVLTLTLPTRRLNDRCLSLNTECPHDSSTISNEFNKLFLYGYYYLLLLRNK